MTKRNNPNLDTKKSAILKNQKNKLNPVPILVGTLILLSAAAIGYYITSNSSSMPASEAQAGIATDDSQIIYPVNLFEDGKAHHFDFKTSDLTVRYFIVKSSDGVIRAAFDACDVCWPAGKGYYQDSDDMVCRNCGRRFTSVLVNEVQGGCNPAPLNRRIQGDKLVLTIEDIITGRTYFDFKGKA